MRMGGQFTYITYQKRHISPTLDFTLILPKFRKILNLAHPAYRKPTNEPCNHIKDNSRETSPQLLVQCTIRLLPYSFFLILIMQPKVVCLCLLAMLLFTSTGCALPVNVHQRPKKPAAQHKLKPHQANGLPPKLLTPALSLSTRLRKPHSPVSFFF